jgi:hypothetical protein
MVPAVPGDHVSQHFIGRPEARKPGPIAVGSKWNIIWGEPFSS